MWLQRKKIEINLWLQYVYGIKYKKSLYLILSQMEIVLFEVSTYFWGCLKIKIKIKIKKNKKIEKFFLIKVISIFFILSV